MKRSELPPHPSATYVVPDLKLVYVSVPKAACTTFKWLIAGLTGEDPERFHAIRSPEVTRSTTIHRRSQWQHTPRLRDLTDAQLRDITPENGWMVFAVTRHPTARLWSGWQSKFLLREPRFVKEFGDADWMPRVPRSTDEVIEDWTRFVASLGTDPEQPVLRDRHFMPQAQLLKLPVMPYTKLYDTSEISTLLGDLDRHLTAQGWTGSLETPHTNETPLQPLARALSPEVMATITSLYARDFAELGYDDPMPRKMAAGDAYPQSALDGVGLAVERAERIGDLLASARGLELELKASQAEVRRLLLRKPPASKFVRMVRRPALRVFRAVTRPR